MYDNNINLLQWLYCAVMYDNNMINLYDNGYLFCALICCRMTTEGPASFRGEDETPSERAGPAAGFLGDSVEPNDFI